VLYIFCTAEEKTNDIILILIAIFSVLFGFGILYLIYEKRKNMLWTGKPAYKNQTLNKIIESVYKFLKDFPLSSGYVDRISYRYRFICPCDIQTIAGKTVSICFLSWSISALAFILIYLTNQRLITLVNVAFIIVLINNEVIGRKAKKFELDSLFETQKLVEEFCHYFHVYHRVDDALLKARDSLKPYMKAAVDQIYDVLLSEDKEAAIRMYYDNVSNKYLREFVSLCAGVMERGDQIVNGKLLFIKNLDDLYREIDIETNKLQKLNMEFLGVVACVIAPAFCIDFVKQFALILKENMRSFYYGQKGFLFDLALLIFIMCVYIIMRKSAEYKSFHQSDYKWLFKLERIPLIKKALDNYCEKYASRMERLQRKLRNCGYNIRPRHFILRSYLISLVVFITSFGLTLYLQKTERQQLQCVNVAEMEMLTSAATEKNYEAMAQVIEKNVVNYVNNKNFDVTVEEVTNKIISENKNFNSLIINALAKDIVKRINSYKKQFFSFINLCECICLSVIAYFFPYLIMKYNSAVSKDAMEDEVNQFNALINMLMYNSDISVKQILEEMESFAVVFRNSIRTCINDYASGDIEALEKLKESEPYEPFRRVVDNLIRCDEMPIYMAFEEINIDKEGYISKRKLANEKSIKKRVFRAYMLAALPFLLLFAYGLLPALISAVAEMNHLLEELNSMPW